MSGYSQLLREPLRALCRRGPIRRALIRGGIRQANQFGPARGVERRLARASRILNRSLKSIVAQAYGVGDHNVFGPAWIESERFEIVAKISPEMAKLPEKARWKQIQARVSHFSLNDSNCRSIAKPVRCRIRASPHERRIEAQRDGPPSNDWVRAQRPREPGAKTDATVQLISILGGVLHREVLDESGIQGVFDIALDWAPDDVAANPPTSRAPDKPSIFTALQERAGQTRIAKGSDGV